MMQPLYETSVMSWSSHCLFFVMIILGNLGWSVHYGWTKIVVI